MAGLDRYISILRLYREDRSAFTVQEMAEALNAPASTLYRIVREMVKHHFLEPANDAYYRLGAAFIEYDRLTRVTDPLVRLGQPILNDVVLQAQVPCVGLLARLYHNTVMCVADARSKSQPPHTSYERGKPMPLVRGATSKSILANLPSTRLKKIVAENIQSLKGRPFAVNEQECREEIQMIRRRGYCVSHGEIDKGMTGIAAPILLPDRGLIGSLSLVVESAQLDESNERRLTLLAVSAASMLTEKVLHHDTTREPASEMRAS